MTQVNGFKGFVGYSIRELDSNEIINYCPNSLSLSTLPITTQNQTNFTSNFMIRTYFY